MVSPKNPSDPVYSTHYHVINASVRETTGTKGLGKNGFFCKEYNEVAFLVNRQFSMKFGQKTSIYVLY